MVLQNADICRIIFKDYLLDNFELNQDQFSLGLLSLTHTNFKNLSYVPSSGCRKLPKSPYLIFAEYPVLASLVQL